MFAILMNGLTGIMIRAISGNEKGLEFAQKNLYVLFSTKTLGGYHGSLQAPE